MQKTIIILLSVFLGTAAVSADEYLISQYRAAPGNFPALIELVKHTKWSAYGSDKPVIMRHSNGNHWDLMLILKHNLGCKTDIACAEMSKNYENALNDLVDFHLSFTASSETSWASIQRQNENAGLYHVEMFKAAAGKHRALLHQRHIENGYLSLTGQLTNVIFTNNLGSDFDVFTVGFHASLKSFATSPDLTTEQIEKAATDAGFKNRADISFNLREQIVGHQDTLAVPVK